MTEQTLTIARLSHDLRGIAFAPLANSQASTWFVDGALPDETVLVQVEKEHSNRIDARTVDVISASPVRVAPRCEYVGSCGGCQLQHIAADAQLQFKRESLRQQLAKAIGADSVPEIEVISDEPWRYRRRARISLRWDNALKQLNIGFRAQQSQQIVDIDHCAVLAPALSAMLPVIREQLGQWSRPKLLGHVELIAADNAQALVLRVLEAPSGKDAALVEALAAQTGAQVLLQLEEDGEPVWWAGERKALTYTHPASGMHLEIAPNDFVQANGVVNNLMIDRVLQGLQPKPNDQVIELFSGLGNFSLPLAKQVQTVYAYEGSEQLIERARAQAVQVNLQLSLAAMDLSQAQLVAGINKPANKLLLDPPRAGADVALANLALDGIERMVYVSCNPATLARDVQQLQTRGFMLQELVCVDMFPQTAHIEAIAVLVKDTRSKKAKAKGQEKTPAKSKNTALSKNGFKRLKR